MQFSAKSMRDTLNNTRLGGNIEISTRSDGYFSSINSSLLSCGDLGLNEISRLKAIDNARGGRLRSRKTMLVHKT